MLSVLLLPFHIHIVESNDISSFTDYIRKNIPVLAADLISCSNPSCTEHHLALDLASTQLLECIEAAASLCLPKVTNHCHHLVVGWNSTVRSLKEAAKFWHELWVDCGHPTSGVLFQVVQEKIQI